MHVPQFIETIFISIIFGKQGCLTFYFFKQDYIVFLVFAEYFNESNGSFVFFCYWLASICWRSPETKLNCCISEICIQFLIIASLFLVREAGVFSVYYQLKLHSMIRCPAYGNQIFLPLMYHFILFNVNFKSV